MENILKIKVFGKSILFYKFLRTKNSDLHENFFGGQLFSFELKFLHENLSINADARVVNAHSHILSRIGRFTTRVRAFVNGSSFKL